MYLPDVFFLADVFFLICDSILVHLSRGEADVAIYAPDIDQMHVIDHTKGQPAEGHTRCCS